MDTEVDTGKKFANAAVDGRGLSPTNPYENANYFQWFTENIKSIIRQLEHIKARPLAYTSDQFPAIVSFLIGFHIACRLWGNTPEMEMIDEDILIRHGWHPSSLAPLKEMRERGLSHEEIGQEMLTMTIEHWKKRL